MSNFWYLGSLDQVVPGSAKADSVLDNSDCCTRQLPSIVTGQTKELELFDGSDIFASREEWIDTARLCFYTFLILSYATSF